MSPHATTPARLLRLPDVLATTGLSRSTIYRLAGLGRFPRGIKLTERTTAWAASEIADWVESRMAERDGLLAAAA